MMIISCVFLAGAFFGMIVTTEVQVISKPRRLAKAKARREGILASLKVVEQKVCRNDQAYAMEKLVRELIEIEGEIAELNYHVSEIPIATVNCKSRRK